MAARSVRVTIPVDTRLLAAIGELVDEDERARVRNGVERREARRQAIAWVWNSVLDDGLRVR